MTYKSISDLVPYYRPLTYVWGSRVVAFQCVQCGTWVRPRHIHLPDGICHDCTHANEVAAYNAARTWLQALVARTRVIAGGHR
jgi:hypothetical protein